MQVWSIKALHNAGHLWYQGKNYSGYDASAEEREPLEVDSNFCGYLTRKEDKQHIEMYNI